MRILKTVILMIVSVLIGLSCLTVTSLAVSPEIHSEPLGEVAFSIETLIAEKAPREKVEKQYHMFSVEKPETFTYDPSRYLLAYNAPRDFWKDLLSSSYEDLIAALASPYPDVYLPIYGDGNTADRVIGQAKLAYNWLEKDYCLQLGIANLTSQAFRNKKAAHPYEYVTDYLAQCENEPHQVFLLRHFSSYAEGQEIVAVLKFETETVILDVSNSAHVEGQEETIIPTAYTVEEFRTLRLAAEEDIYGHSGIEEEHTQVFGRNMIELLWPIALAGLVVVLVVAFVLIKKRRAKG